jgi:hypothetical protein
MKRWPLLLALLSPACVGVVGEPEGLYPFGQGEDGDVPDEDTGCAPVSRNDEIRLALTATCRGCHLVGSRPFFASLEAFENGLAYNQRYVVRGDPEASLLIELLRGTAPGTYRQMPPVTSYAQLYEQGLVTLSIAEVESWIRDLPPAPSGLSTPAPERFTVRRLTAEEMVVSLMDQLGLATSDFAYVPAPGWPWTVIPGRLFVWPTDWMPGIDHGYGSDGRANERYEALGGAVTLAFRKRDRQLTPGGVQVLVQMSQAWCRRAIDKPGNRAVLGDLPGSATSATHATAIRDNIRRLYVRMLGKAPSSVELDEIYTQLYLPLEPKGTAPAWTAVCSSLVRHPLWVSY